MNIKYVTSINELSQKHGTSQKYNVVFTSRFVSSGKQPTVRVEP